MRFAYIDSQGKEVPIPSTDALRLRIELGAIVDATEFYDAGADRWAPAAEHEIYRTLRRELEEQETGGFVAPPPSAISGSEGAPDEESSPPAPAAAEGAPSDEGELAGEGELVEDPPSEVERTAGEGQSPEGDPFPEDDALDLDLGGLTLTEGPEGSPDDASSAAPVVEDDDSFDFEGFGALELEDPPVPDGEEAPVLDEDSSAFDEDSSAFDEDSSAFDENVLVPEEEAPVSGADSGAGGLTLDAPARWDTSDEVSGPGPEAFEHPAAANSEEGGDIPGFGGALEPEVSPPPDEGTEEPRGWAVEAEATEELGGGVGEAPPRRRGPRSGPPPRKLTPKRSLGPGRLAATVILALALMGGGWFALDLLRGGDAAAAGGETVALPDLPSELQPQLRQFAQRASLRMVERFDSLPERLALAGGPGNEWLGGHYLANAGEYTEVAVYWRNIGELVQAMREKESAFFEEAFRAEVEAANPGEPDRSLLLDRGFAGFRAAAPDRAIIYDQLRGVVDAAVDLHLFLRQNQENIDYEPAEGGISRDPLLEAVPITQSLGAEMMSRVVEITEALDALGYLDVVETDPLLEVVREKLVATGIR